MEKTSMSCRPKRRQAVYDAIQTSMLEHIGSGVDDLIEDLIRGSHDLVRPKRLRVRSTPAIE